MHRRDVLKALTALPLAMAFGGCEKRPEEKTHSNTVEVHLAGAFALVIQENKASSILAFSPRPAKTDEPHQVYFNGSTKLEDAGKAYSFKLSDEGHIRVEKPEISPGLNDFTFRAERWHVSDSLVSIELPAPKKITFSGHRSAVTFLSDHRQAFMPTNHILEYDLKDSIRPKLECSEPTLKCESSQDSFPGVTRFFFEVGPKRALELTQSHVHANNFFNYILQQSFPDLEKQFQLVVPDSRKQAYVQSYPRLVPAVFRPGTHDVALQNASYAVDCEFGGPIVVTHSPANP